MSVGRWTGPRRAREQGVPQPRPALSGRRADVGQSVVELALVLPILLGLLGAGLDYSRFESMRQKLEAATRAAAEYAATTSTSTAAATSGARRILCAEFGKVATCTDPSITVTWSSCTDTSVCGSSAPGASTRYPFVTVRVQSTTPFQTLFPYPLLTNRGTVTLSAMSSLDILQGR